MRARLPAELVELVAAAGRLAGERGEELYLVGGAVRDLLLRRPNLDLDLVLEGNAPSLARRLARLGSDRVVTHPRFGTATVHRGSFAIDIVTARSETYAAPGALPSVTPGSIQDDLFRRDFTINAMAISINRESFGRLIDFFGGERDLLHGRIKVLHEGSFIDDPTRIFRAVRFESRFAFAIDHLTEELIKNDEQQLGDMSERLMVPVSKTGVGNTTEGSNPSISASPSPCSSVVERVVANDDTRVRFSLRAPRTNSRRDAILKV